MLNFKIGKLSNFGEFAGKISQIHVGIVISQASQVEDLLAREHFT